MTPQAGIESLSYKSNMQNLKVQLKARLPYVTQSAVVVKCSHQFFTLKFDEFFFFSSDLISSIKFPQKKYRK
ncbi:CLUMA_CG012310, isoform A [Clunio marinus]|uniref:CLUMA_CG012310, isoform A n=1 Tax=Clunio marinus TaxID=568069 RepID=A0A1J1IHL7_9DIPT|nr:CLUMA_CG012310, isoform A [Clunio marinus]